MDQNYWEIRCVWIGSTACRAKLNHRLPINRPHVGLLKNEVHRAQTTWAGPNQDLHPNGVARDERPKFGLAGAGIHPNGFICSVSQSSPRMLSTSSYSFICNIHPLLISHVSLQLRLLSFPVWVDSRISLQTVMRIEIQIYQSTHQDY